MFNLVFVRTLGSQNGQPNIRKKTRSVNGIFFSLSLNLRNEFLLTKKFPLSSKSIIKLK